jgi:hypothetical protein
MLVTKPQIQILGSWNKFHSKEMALNAEVKAKDAEVKAKDAEVKAKDEEISRMARLLRDNNINPDPPIQGESLGI